MKSDQQSSGSGSLLAKYGARISLAKNQRKSGKSFSIFGYQTWRREHGMARGASSNAARSSSNVAASKVKLLWHSWRRSARTTALVIRRRHQKTVTAWWREENRRKTCGNNVA
jgi:hypothetical protein